MYEQRKEIYLEENTDETQKTYHTTNLDRSINKLTEMIATNNSWAKKMTTAQELAMIIKTRRELDELMEKIHPYLISPTNDIQTTVGSSDADTVSTVLYVPHPQSPIGLPTTDNEAFTPDLESSPVLAKKE
jgi:uncharacterized protein involved in tolerance to divalent cations